jgi:hypothetical protein
MYPNNKDTGNVYSLEHIDIYECPIHPVSCSLEWFNFFFSRTKINFPLNLRAKKPPGNIFEDKVFVVKSKGKWTLRKLRPRCEDGIRMDLREIGWGGGWSGFSWLRTGAGGGLLWVRWWTFGFWRHGVSKYTNYIWYVDLHIVSRVAQSL